MAVRGGGMHSQRTSSANSARNQMLCELYLHRICRLSPNVPAAMLSSELNVLRLKVFLVAAVSTLWNNVVAAPLDSFHRTVLLDNVQDAVRFRAHNFSGSVAIALQSVGQTS